MQSVHKQVLSIISRFSQGTIFFPEKFDFLGSSESVRQALSRICKEGTIIRLSKGVYLFPFIDKELGVLFPSIERIAKAIAIRDKSRLLPTGLYALNKLGLSTQVPMKVVFYTDGIPRKISIGNQIIVFKKIAPKNFTFKGKITPLIVAALKEIGKDNINNNILLKLKETVKLETKEVVHEDAHIAPQWITDIIIKLTND
ncbi:MAG: type IV toxin-antitoxin system AbiEi family antitoxin domain-containing protein [Dysgonamonadaceae bacterium]|jgi:hypothetical protein|nr:type IV toxin-antitoxin system AbiEi family antitoxin domain-containing protein [Dysgonamonadaceae bacterium]